MVKITRIKYDRRGKTTLTASSLDKFMERMTKDDSKNTVLVFRNFVSMTQNHYGRGRRWTGDYYLMHQMPSFLPSLDITKDKQGNETMRAFNGIVTLSVDHIDEETDLEAVKRVAAMMPMTLAAFIGSTGTTVKILVKVEPKDGHAITTEEEAEEFCGLSYDIVVKMYDAVINHNVQMAASAREGNCLYAGFRLPLDPKPYYNPKASAMRIETIAQGKPLQVTQPINDRQFTGEDGFMSDSDSDIRQMLEYLKSRYEFRYNMLEYVPEMKFLKNIMQLPTVKVKLPYARSIETLPRRASFIATTNMTDILADPSGSRRFIGVELTAPIDVTTSINYDQLYAQAIDAIYKGERYWFDQQETEELIAHNRKYQMLSPAEQYFRLCFEVCQDPSEGEYLSAAAIFQRIKQVAGSSLGISAVTKFGQFLTNIDGIVRKRTNSGMVYLVRPLK